MRTSDPAAAAALEAIVRHCAEPMGPLALRSCLEVILETTGFQAGVIRLLEPMSGELTAAAAAGFPGGLDRQVRPKVNVADAPSGITVQRREPVILDPQAHPAFVGGPWRTGGYRTFLSRPLRYGDMVLGSVNLAHADADAAPPGVQDLLGLLTTPVGLAVANSELYGTAQRKLHYLAALHECSREVGQAPGLDQALALVAERMSRLLNLHRTLVLTRDDDGVTLSVRASHGHETGPLGGLRLPVAAVESATDGMEVTVTEDVQALGGATHVLRGPLLVVPFRHRGHTLGLLLADREGRPLLLSPNELELAAIFGGQASVWINSAHLLLREKAARALAEAARAHLRSLLELAPDAILAVDASGHILMVNSQVERLFGRSREALLGQPIEILIPARFRESHIPRRDHYLLHPHTRPMGIGVDLLGLRADGTEFPVEISLGPSQEGGREAAIAVIRDVTERRQAEAERMRLLASERQKSEQLKLAIREAHHRIKNNLQAISDLIYLELTGTGGANPADALRESVDRIQSIALVHDLLSQEEDVQTVDTGAMAERLVPMVLRANGLSAEAIALELDLSSHPVSSRKATTLALIINELVSNAAKHALVGRGGGRLAVSVSAVGQGLRLCVEDDGPGLPEGFELARCANVGLQVVQTLTTRDLGGELQLSEGPCLRAEVWFPG